MNNNRENFVFLVPSVPTVFWYKEGSFTEVVENATKLVLKTAEI